MEKPANLGIRGDSLWENVTAEKEFDAAGYAMLEDVCRTADIIHNLTGMLRNKRTDWLKMAEENDLGDEGTVRVIVNVHPLLGEVRQQRIAMRQMMNQLGIASAFEGDDENGKAAKDFWGSMEAEFNKK